MNKILPLGAALLLAACAGFIQPPAPVEQGVNVLEAAAPNPASAFCVRQGGKSEIRIDKDGGEYGMCVFADGREEEEWAYYREHGDKREHVETESADAGQSAAQ